jgi:O-antigen/teichoic acid export membrane protein
MFGSKVGVLLLQSVNTIIVARAFGASGRGVLAVAFALMMLLVQLGSLGIHVANPYFAARDRGVIAQIVANSLWFAVGLGAVLAGIGLLIKAVAPGALPDVTWLELGIAMLGVPIALCSLFLQGVLLGEGRTVAYNGVEAATAVFGTLALILAVLVFDAGVPVAMAILCGGQIVMVCGCGVLLHEHGPRYLKFDVGLARAMTKYGLRVHLATVVAFLLIRLDMLLVNGFLGSSDAGQYSIAVAGADLMYLIPTVVAINIFAHVARGANDEVTARVFRAMILLYGAVCLIAIPLVGPAIELAFGPQFRPATDLFYWLLPGIFCLGMLNLLAQHFAGRGLPIEAALVWLPGLAINLAINVAFLSHGAYVASLSSSVAYALVLLFHMRLFARQTGGYSNLVPNVRDTGRLIRVALTRSPG